METIILDGASASTRAALHDQLAQKLSFPDYYGRNLDALYDLLTERPESTRLLIRRRDALMEALGVYGASFLKTLEEASLENPLFQVAFEEET